MKQPLRRRLHLGALSFLAAGACSAPSSTQPQVPCVPACSQTQSCQGGGCVSGCGPANCQGCCKGTACVALASESASQCGAAATAGAACIACGSGQSCQSGTCTGGMQSCTPETDAAFCQRLGKNCDATSAADNCGNARTANCGACASPQTCGGTGTANVCSCPASVCPGGDALFQNGSRLKWQTFTTPDGARGYWGWYDSQAGVTCSAWTAADGTQRCLPLSGVAVGNYFLDSACTVPLAYGCTPAGTPAYAVQYGASGASVFPVTGAYQGSAYISGGSSCTATTTSGFSFFTVGSETPASSWVAVTTLAPGAGPAPAANDAYQDGTRVRLLLDSSSDGSLGPYDWLDSQLGTHCYFATTSDGLLRCHPTPMGSAATFFDDSACTQPVLGQSTSVSTLPSFAVAGDANGCELAYYSVGSPTGAAIYEGTTASCSAYSGTGFTFYGLASTPVTTFTLAQSTSAAGPYAGFASGSRIQMTVATTTDGARGPVQWTDAQLGSTCLFEYTSDGALRCVPSQLAYADGYYFADSACTQPLAFAAADCSSPQYVEDVSVCQASYAALGPAYSGQVYFSSGASCLATTFSRPMYQVGSPMPLDDFVALTLSH